MLVSIEIRARSRPTYRTCSRPTRAASARSTRTRSIARRLPIMDLSRFRIALDGPATVGVAGSFALDMTVPGGATVPMGGVTWVSVATTHRRQGILRRLLGAIHADIDDRGEPVAGLGASEGAIYGRFGYGVASQLRRVAIDVRAVRLARRARAQARVRALHGDRRGPGPRRGDLGARQAAAARRDGPQRNLVGDGLRRPVQAAGRVLARVRLRHDDGYATYRVRTDWNEGRPAHQVNLIELVAVTDDAHLALWHTLLGIDLVAIITSRRAFAIDDALYPRGRQPRREHRGHRRLCVAPPAPNRCHCSAPAPTPARTVSSWSSSRIDGRRRCRADAVGGRGRS